jgi:NAD+ synthase (glutamine-hydrolysing)
MAGTEHDGRRLRVMVAQLNMTVGDVVGNTDRIIDTIEHGREAGADLVVLPELAVCGYPPEDLLLRTGFLEANERAVARIAPHTVGLTAVVGFAHIDLDLYNAAAVLHDGDLADIYCKALLPNYSVFDEERYFSEGRRWPVYVRSEARIGVSVCEDIWHPGGPPQHQALAGANVLVNISSSPFFAGKAEDRERMLATRARDNVAYLVFCNLVGGQDELVFDGNSVVIDPTGRVLDRGASLAEDVFVVDIDVESVFHERLLDPRHRNVEPDARTGSVPTVVLRDVPLGRQSPEGPGHVGVATPAQEETLPLLPPSAAVPDQTVSRLPGSVAFGPGGEMVPVGAARPLGGLDEIYAALVLGVRDYVRKNGFSDVVIALSGGIDSALTAVVAVDALGAEHVLGISMPTRFTSQASMRDAEELAANLGFRLVTVPIDETFDSFLELLGPHFEGLDRDVTEENLQPRIRSIIVMAFSNKLGHLVLTTGNKSEISVGYVTLYGDSAGGFAPLKDVPKTRVYELARWRNARADGPVIPRHTIERPPSAELRPDQLDSDSLPSYDVLDPILELYVEGERSIEDIVASGFDRATVEKVARLVDRAEYKRRQSPPGIKITERAFGRDRRMPITKQVNLG